MQLDVNIRAKVTVGLILWCVTLASFADERTNIKLITEEWPPFNYMENGELTGFSTEIVEQIVILAQANVNMSIAPSMRAKHLLDNGSNVMFFSIFRTPERENQYQWIGPIGEGSVYFYKRKDDPTSIETLADVRKVAIVATRQDGLVYRTLIGQGFDNLDATTDNGMSIYLKLLTGRSDLAISESPLGVSHIFKKLDKSIDLIEQTNVKLIDADLYIAASLDIPNDEIIRWQQALDELKANGTYDRIYSKYYQQ